MTQPKLTKRPLTLADKRVRELRWAGDALSNVAFNWSQLPGRVLTEHDAHLLRKLYIAWDVAVAKTRVTGRAR